MLLQSQEIGERLKVFVPGTSPLARVSIDELETEDIDDPIRRKLVAAAIWAQRGQPEGQSTRTEFGEVGSVRLVFDGQRSWPVNAKSLLELVQARAPSRGATTASLAGAARCRQLFEFTHKGTARWGTGGHPRDTSLLTSRSALVLRCREC